MAIVVDTSKLTDLKTELEQLCLDLDLLITNSGDENKIQEVSNSLDEMIEQAGECVEMLDGEDDELNAQLREAAGLPPEEGEEEDDEIDPALVEAHKKMHEGTEYAEEHDHTGIDEDVHDKMHEMMDE